MIMGGKSIEIEEDDYCYAAFLLYTSIVRILINIIRILGLLDWGRNSVHNMEDNDSFIKLLQETLLL